MVDAASVAVVDDHEPIAMAVQNLRAATPEVGFVGSAASGASALIPDREIAFAPAPSTTAMNAAMADYNEHQFAGITADEQALLSRVLERIELNTAGMLATEEPRLST